MTTPFLCFFYSKVLCILSLSFFLEFTKLSLPYGFADTLLTNALNDFRGVNFRGAVSVRIYVGLNTFASIDHLLSLPRNIFLSLLPPNNTLLIVLLRQVHCYIPDHTSYFSVLSFSLQTCCLCHWKNVRCISGPWHWLLSLSCVCCPLAYLRGPLAFSSSLCSNVTCCLFFLYFSF